MIIAATGHRPDLLGGYGDDVLSKLSDLAAAELQALHPSKVLVGMALGWDTAVAMACVFLEIPFEAAVPFKGQELRWPKPAQDRYNWLLTMASKVVILSETYEGGATMHKRNHWMVDRCDLVLALFSGGPGGAAGCVEYAEKKGKKIINLWPRWEALHGAARL